MKNYSKRDPSSHRTPGQIHEMDHGYEASPKMVKHRELNNQARAMFEREGRVHKGDGLDVNHRKMLKDGGKTTQGNLNVETEHKNRGWRRDT